MRKIYEITEDAYPQLWDFLNGWIRHYSCWYLPHRAKHIAIGSSRLQEEDLKDLKVFRTFLHKGGEELFIMPVYDQPLPGTYLYCPWCEAEGCISCCLTGLIPGGRL